MIVRVVEVLRSLSLIRRIVATIATSGTIELSMVRLPRVRLDLIV